MTVSLTSTQKRLISEEGYVQVGHRIFAPGTYKRMLQAREMRVSGATLAEIGRAIGRSPERVRQLLSIWERLSPPKAQ